MTGQKYRLFFFYGTIVFGLLLSSHVRSETLQKKTEKAAPEPIVIESKSLEMNNELKLVTFLGDVNAKIDDFVIDCNKMLVYYENPPDQKATGEVEARINKLVATGDVRINRVQGGVATAENAVYYQGDEKIVLTGSPALKQRNDLLEGDRITIFLKENRIIVDGSEDTKVNVTIFPGREKR